MYMPSIFGESLFDNMFPFDEKFFTEKKDPCMVRMYPD